MKKKTNTVSLKIPKNKNMNKIQKTKKIKECFNVEFEVNIENR